VVTFDRRGYGASGAPEPYERTTVAEQAEDVAALLRALAPGPVVLGGADFGALACLEVALRHSVALAGLALFEPYAFNLVAEATAALSAQRAQLEQAIRDGGPGAAIEAWLGERAGEERLERALARTRAFFADYAGLATWPVTRAELRALALPVAIVDGPSTPPHVRAAGDALAALLPAPRRCGDGALDEAIVELLNR
jgi:pimeloyl-ACP methyl ester carboxylesterase